MTFVKTEFTDNAIFKGRNPTWDHGSLYKVHRYRNFGQKAEDSVSLLSSAEFGEAAGKRTALPGTGREPERPANTWDATSGEGAAWWGKWAYGVTDTNRPEMRASNGLSLLWKCHLSAYFTMHSLSQSALNLLGHKTKKMLGEWKRG